MMKIGVYHTEIAMKVIILVSPLHYLVHRVFFVSNHISTKCGPRTRNVARNVAHYAARYVLCRNSHNHAAFQPGRQILHVPNFNTSFKTHCKFSTCNICLSN